MAKRIDLIPGVYYTPPRRKRPGTVTEDDLNRETYLCAFYSRETCETEIYVKHIECGYMPHSSITLDETVTRDQIEAELRKPEIAGAFDFLAKSCRVTGPHWNEIVVGDNPGEEKEVEEALWILECLQSRLCPNLSDEPQY